MRERRCGVERGQQRWPCVKLFTERFERALVAQRTELRLLHQVGRDLGRERTGDVAVRQGISDQRRLAAGVLLKPFPGRLIARSRCWYPAGSLERGQCALEIRS